MASPGQRQQPQRQDIAVGGHFLSCPLVMVRSVDAVGAFLLSLLRVPASPASPASSSSASSSSIGEMPATAPISDTTASETSSRGSFGRSETGDRSSDDASLSLTVVEVPCRYATLHIPPPPGSCVGTVGSSLVMVQSDSCDEELRSSLATYAVRQLFLCVNDPREIQKRAISLGAQVSESKVGIAAAAAGGSPGDFCVVEAPEGITVHFMSTSFLQRSRGPSEIIVNSLIINKSDQETEKSPKGEVSADTLKSQQRAARPSKPRPAIRTLDVAVQSDAHPLGIVPCPANSRKPTPFETEIFKGVALIVVRTEPIDEYYADFFTGRRRVFEVQVQGKFKRMPVGEIYVGADVTNKMELGIITRSFSRAVLKFVGTMVNDLHYSFGDFPDVPGFEKPHLVAPLFPTMDKIVVTPEGETPPPMGAPFPEDPEFRKIRFKNKVTNDLIDLKNTYSFSVNTSNMDLLTWCLVGIPMVHTLDMRTFFGDSPIRLVGYELPAEVAAKFPDKHPSSALNYVFNMRLTPVDGGSQVPLHFEEPDEGEAGGSSSGGEDAAGPAASLGASALPRVPSAPQIMDAIAEADNEEIDGEDEQARLASVVEAEDYLEGKQADEHPSTPNRTPRRLPWRRSADATHPEGGKIGVGRWLRREIGELFSHDDMATTGPSGSVASSPSVAQTGKDWAPDDMDCPPDISMESSGDLRYCPACIDVADYRKEGKRRLLFAFPWAGQATAPTGGELSVLSNSSAPYKIKLRSMSEFERYFPVSRLTRLSKIKRISGPEKQRRQLVESYKTLLTKPDASVNNFFSSTTDGDKHFLGMAVIKISNSKKAGDADREVWEGSVALATDRRHWVESFLQLSSTELAISKLVGARKTFQRISLGSILRVRAMAPREVPMDMYSFFCVETFARTYYFMVRSAKQLDAWLQIIGSAIQRKDDGLSVAVPKPSLPLPNLVEEIYFGKSDAWKFEKRRLLNYRNIFFRPSGLPEDLASLSAAQLSQGLLEKVFSIAQVDGGGDIAQWISFMNWASALQVVDFTALSGADKIAVYLNVFHSMVLHAMIVIGPPASWSSWPSFFNFFSYMICFDFISMSEFEHNILRAAMSRPSALLSKIAVPQTAFPGIALTQRDFRLNFCINNGSLSLSSVVPVYAAATLDRQLDEMTMLMLAETAHVDYDRRAVVLPRVCSWFLPDFNSGHEEHAAPADCLRIIAPYLRPDDRRALARMAAEGEFPRIRFRPYNFRCRAFAELIDVIDS